MSVIAPRCLQCLFVVVMLFEALLALGRHRNFEMAAVMVGWLTFCHLFSGMRRDTEILVYFTSYS